MLGGLNWLSVARYGHSDTSQDAAQGVADALDLVAKGEWIRVRDDLVRQQVTAFDRDVLVVLGANEFAAAGGPLENVERRLG